MSTSHVISRRSALAGLGAGSLGLFLGASRAAADAVQTGGGGGEPLAAAGAHPLTGLWLSHVALSADGDETAAAPAFFGADGTAVLVYPCAEAGENGTQIRGLALGTWAPIDDHEARFTAVQVCFGADGSYQGTRTYDGYPVVSDDGASFTVKGEFDVLTVRDAGNAIIESRIGGRRAMFGTRMGPGNPGFASYLVADSPESDEDVQQVGAPLDPNFPEGVAPSDPNDPRLRPTGEDSVDNVGISEVAPVHPGDPRLIP